MNVSVPKWWSGLCDPRRLRRLMILLGGGMLLQAAAGGCDASASAIVDALGQSVAAGIGNGLSQLAEGLVLTLFI